MLQRKWNRSLYYERYRSYCVVPAIWGSILRISPWGGHEHAIIGNVGFTGSEILGYIDSYVFAKQMKRQRESSGRGRGLSACGTKSWHIAVRGYLGKDWIETLSQLTATSQLRVANTTSTVNLRGVRQTSKQSCLYSCRFKSYQLFIYVVYEWTQTRQFTPPSERDHCPSSCGNNHTSFPSFPQSTKLSLG